MTYATDAIVLKKIPTGEQDALFICYTAEFGKIAAKAISVQKEAAKLKGHLEPLNRCDIQFVIGKSGMRLTHAAMTDHWCMIRASLGKIRAASYVLALIDRHTMSDDPNPRLWELMVASLAILNREEFDKQGYQRFFSAFEERMLDILGFAGTTDLRVAEGFPVLRPE